MNSIADLDRMMSYLQITGHAHMHLRTDDDLRIAMSKVDSMADTLAVKLEVKQGIHGWDIWVADDE